MLISFELSKKSYGCELEDDEGSLGGLKGVGLLIVHICFQTSGQCMLQQLSFMYGHCCFLYMCLFMDPKSAYDLGQKGHLRL